MSNTNGFINLPVGIYLNVRQEPNLYSTVLTSLAPKTELTILEQNGEWYKINYKGLAGYVFANAVEVTSTIKQAGMSLNLDVPNNFEFGNTGEQPTFNWNALVTTSFIPIKNSNGVIQNGYSTSNGDHITIIKNNPELGLTFIQYPDQGANMYQQGWIDSTYISSQYLDFRFSQAWLNQEDNQKVYLFDNTISSITLTKNSKYTLLYTVSNYNIEYSCILFEENGQQQLGFIPFKTGSLNFVVSEYPYNIFNECSVGYLKPTVPLNATVNTTVELIDINGIRPYSYINKKNITIYPSLSSGDRISIIQAFTSAEEQSILIEYYDSGSNTYKKAYLPIETLNNNSVSIDKNTINWGKTTGTYDLVDLTDSSIIYKLPVGQSVQYLYTVENFACILFNNNNLSGWPLQTGYVDISSGKFINKTSIDSMFVAQSYSISYCVSDCLKNFINNQNDYLESIEIDYTLTPNKKLTAIDEINTIVDSLIIRDLNGVLVTKLNISKENGSNNWLQASTNSIKYLSLNLSMDSSILNKLILNCEYKLSIGFTFYGIQGELPFKFASTCNMPESDSFKILLDSSSDISLKMLPRYLFMASFDSASYLDDSVSLLINTESINKENLIKFDKSLEKALIIKDDSGNIITTIFGKQIANSNEKDNYTGLLVSLTKDNLAELSLNTQYNLFIEFNFENNYIEIPVMFNSSILRTNLLLVYPTDCEQAVNQTNNYETSIKLLDTDFVANLKFGSVNNSQNKLFLLGNIIGDVTFTRIS